MEDVMCAGAQMAGQAGGRARAGKGWMIGDRELVAHLAMVGPESLGGRWNLTSSTPPRSADRICASWLEGASPCALDRFAFSTVSPPTWKVETSGDYKHP